MNPQQPFRVGDLVRHTAGHTKMAISQTLKPSGDYVCHWQDASGTHCQQVYPGACLQPWSEYEQEQAAKRERINEQVAQQRTRGSSFTRARRG